MPLVFLYWFFAGPALLLAVLSLRGERKRAVYVARRLAESPQDMPPVTVIVPVKGYDEGLSENLGALAALDYPDYELIVAAHSALDIPPGVLPARVKVVLAHGTEPDGSANIAACWRSPIPTAWWAADGCARWWRRSPNPAWALPPAIDGSCPIRPISGR